MTSSELEPAERAGEVPDDAARAEDGSGGGESVGEAGDTAGVVSEADR